MYPYESMDPERFQQFCQALLVRDFPSTQCFPVGQRDGGRDAALFFSGTGKAFRVFQVKFVRNPWNDFDAKAWLDDVIQKELPKIATLIPKGAVGYHFITNVGGTAYLDSGTIDTLNQGLAAWVGIPATAWWRDDLDRRLDSAWALKWRYSELMTGSDLIRLVIEAGSKEHQQRRIAAIAAFIRDQYERDKEVKFKQIELQNKLLDLFIDVPVSPAERFATRKQAVSFSRWWRSVSHAAAPTPEVDLNFESAERRDEKAVGGADLLLNRVDTYIRRLVLEGAPGQGKSTIGQYACQVHRMRLLGERSDLAQIPLHHCTSPLRLPFKIDLRDLSAWLAKSNPFAAEEGSPLPPYWNKSLESFLAAQVRNYSGGTEFSVDDLLAILRLSAVLLVFDGLDEVAEIARRQEVVNEIVRGVNRIEENAASLQVIVTSRPAAFANSPGMPEKDFYHFHLDSVTPALIEQYADKWLKARRLFGREGAEVRRILKDKMGQPHIKDLARNPMQLAILLSLIHRRGSSLPDKRTALYDNYVDLFFSRESEKSSTVREHRDLLIDLHRYVAWLLHTEAEKGGTHTGSISVERLQRVLNDYLRREGHDTSLVEALFHGMVERVIALVSRVQGTFEFEVQPLREYFAARFLYETAPYSPPGDERKGTKPDRFDAIARDFYWLNVTRFYAGCFSKGELPSLVDRLQELIRDDNFKGLSHPRTLAAFLLSDWVFSQHPRSVGEVVGLISDPLGLRFMVTSPRRKLGGASPLALPKRNGSEELVKKCFGVLRGKPPMDFALDVIDVIKANLNTQEALELWRNEVYSAPIARRREWFEYGLNIGALAHSSPEELEDLLIGTSETPMLLSAIFRAHQTAFIESSESRCSIVANTLLDGLVDIPANVKGGSVLDKFAAVLHPWTYLRPHHFPHDSPLRNSLSSEELGSFSPFRDGSEVLQKCAAVVEIVRRLTDRTVGEWIEQIEPWDKLIEGLRSVWEDRWQFLLLGNIGVARKPPSPIVLRVPDLLDTSATICSRLLYARSRPTASSWWERQFSNTSSELEQDFVLLAALTWAGVTTIKKLSPMISRMLDQLPEDRWTRLARGVELSVSFARREKRISSLHLAPIPRSHRLTVMLSLRGSRLQRQRWLRDLFSDYKGKDRVILQLLSQRGFEVLFYSNGSFNIDAISRAYLAGVVSDRYAFQRGVRYSVTLSGKEATEITSNAANYPGFLVGVAESIMRKAAAQQIVPVASVAENEGWFHQRQSKKKPTAGLQ